MANKNNDFNFEQFAVNAIAQIDRVRSYFDTGNALGTEQQLNSSVSSSTRNKQRESRINAFYRMLGLPAVLEEPKDGQPGIDRFNNGNPHKDLAIKSYERQLDDRQSSFSSKVEQAEIDSFLNNSSQKITGSVTTSVGDKRKRGHLFPMVVDGRIRIHPARRRVAGAFLDKNSYERKWEKDIYPAPLIEHILNIRLKGNSVVNSSSQSSLGQDSMKELIKEFSNGLSSAMLSISATYERAVLSADTAHREMRNDVFPVIANVAQENPELSIPNNPERLGQLDIPRAQIAARKSLQEAKLALFQFDDTDMSFDTKNIYSGTLLDSLIEIQVPRTQESQTFKIEQRIEEEVAEVESLLKQSVRTIDLILGTFSGISGVDIISIIYSLFEIEEAYLVALLNKDSRDRLETLKGITNTNISVYNAISELESIVSKTIESIHKNIIELNLADKTELHNSQETEQ